ncbi:MAG TPA: 16S rRNA (uracil(1498)-N(3))-methyltransferase [Geminicoccaceae bacterium]
MAELRLYVDAPLAIGAPAPGLSREQTHYVLNVMRRRGGDPLLLFNGRDGEWRATIAAASKREVRLDLVLRTRPQQEEPGPALWFAPLKRARQELLLEKATELGVATLRPVLMRRSVVEKVNLARQRAILIEAAEQSGRLTVPSIDPPAGLDAVLAAASGHPVLFADERAAHLLSPSAPDGEHPVPLLEALREHPDADLLIGPEGGFDRGERAALRAASGVVPVSLGPLILRAETAAIAALAAWQALRLGQVARARPCR